MIARAVSQTIQRSQSELSLIKFLIAANRQYAWFGILLLVSSKQVSMMLGNSGASTSGDLTPQTLIHEVIVNYNNACILKGESSKTKSVSCEEDEPSTAINSNKKNGVMQQPTVHIPDMFVDFCSLPPVLNKHYDQVKQDSDTFIRSVSAFNERESKIQIKADFPYLGAILVPDAGPDQFRVVCDWLNWVFDFDDPFDEGELKNRPEEAKKLVDDLLATMESKRLEDSKESGNVLIEVFRSIWLRLARTSSKETQGRFRSSMADHCNGLIEQTGAWVDANNFDLNGYLARKCQTVATYPLYAMVEYCYDLEIDDEIISCESIRTIQQLSTELTVL